MKRFIYTNLLVLLLVLASCSQPKKADETTKPNVILIITDDQGFGDLGYYGNPNIKTPVLDSLAARSVRFDEFLVNPVCAPTRSAIMTGKYCMSTGVHDTYMGGAMMAPSEVTIAELLKEADYKTGMIGKWHLGDNYPMRPQDQGFDYTFNHLSGGIGQYGDWPNTLKRDSSYFDPILWENGKQVQTKGYCTDVLTEAALDYVEENKSNPFFLYLSYNAPHGPLQLPQEYYDMYKDTDPDAGLIDQGMPYPEVTEHSRENARKVYGMVTNIDDNLRLLFNKLETLGLEENTLVIFMTDNGPQHPRYVAGMRGRKGSVFQGGVRVPSFWYYPKAFKEARDIKTPAAHYDILPTIAELTGAKIPTDLDIEGRSLMPLLTKSTEDLSERYISRYWARAAPVRYRNVSTRKGDLKLVGVGKDDEGNDKFELFDLSKDPFERNDISENNRGMVTELKSEMDKWLDSMESSEHILNSPKPIIGTEYENPVMLNQNDAHFIKQEGKKEQLMYWDVEVDASKSFDITVHLDRGLDTNGTLELIIGDETKTIDFEGEGQTSLQFPNVKLNKGTLTIMPKLYLAQKGELKFTYPFYMEIKG
ncbi:arylsulfatase [Maribacter polysaccharolyticus]|uniref:arylsulfatase n=1 Tax=Maribacter polysaccharolyticus TaxID=3020831 RepID=UPI00237EF790|nr:arylsulfatase [Maribacter polysaccharolyticus]MDE3742062.1 arylsulfatase [Maribacter polysaccharolyticus]